MNRALRCLIAIACMCLMGACSPTRHVPQGTYLLDKVDITVDDRSDIETRELYNFLRQTPNHKVLGFARLQLSSYNLSGDDTTKWYNRMLRSVGQPPVLYDRDLTAGSVRQLQLAMVNRGFNHAVVRADTTLSREHRRASVSYHIDAGRPHVVASVGYDIADSTLHAIVAGGRDASLVHPGMLLDRNALDNERTRLTSLFREAGYYDFSRELISYIADTAAGTYSADLTLRIDPRPHMRYTFRNVTFVVDGTGDRRDSTLRADTVDMGRMQYVYHAGRYLRPEVLDEMCYIEPGHTYSAKAVERTYEALGRLPIVRFINIEMKPGLPQGDGIPIDAVIYLSRNKNQSASVEVEGTNSEGDLGFGVGLTYRHRNIGRGSELLTAKVRTSYESLSGNFEGLINKRYTEYAAEVGVTFPKFECPFLTRSFKQRILASTELTVSANYQERPEYTRLIFGSGWKWNWQQKRRDYTRRQSYRLIDVNYVRLPRSTINFIDEIAPANPLLRYSYEDHLIMMMGYSYTHTNRGPADPRNKVDRKPHTHSLRFSAETAGNILYAISSLSGQHRSGGVYKVLGIQYSQYSKADFDYTYTRNIDHRNAVAMRAGTGIAYPYGNSSMVPFEKRFYAGGANGVRGWGVRTLGPGCYDSRNSVTDFINQCGDIRLDLSIEYRLKLFWVLEGAIFADAGNIWTVHAYENQPGGMFKFNKFYKQIAAAYGVGIRFDFTYFLLRLDLGLKAHNPARNQEPWPIAHPQWGRDANFHFAVGYPF